MNETLIHQLGDELYQALTARTVVEPLTSRHEGLTIEHAYQVQQRMLSRRIAAGERVIGKKIGVTSRAVMNMLGVFQPTSATCSTACWSTRVNPSTPPR
jgi:2-oxopent-4-enoate/cis-2-oxohex-4-enoate hydratase